MKIADLPRIPLAQLPTPLDELPRLSEDLGVRVLMKRDDLTGFALGGNKARKLEFLIADALAQRADIIVTGGGAQSNHIRMTAAAARKVGLDARALVFGEMPAEVNGNLLLDDLLGVEIIHTPNDDRVRAEQMLIEIADDLKQQGRRPYLIPIGGSTVLGCISYLLAVGEMREQLAARAISPDHIFITTGSCGTHAGVLTGLKYYGSTMSLYGISVGRPKSECEDRIATLVKKTADFIAPALSVRPNEIIVYDDYIGRGYALITPEARAAIKRVARLEGIFLDQVYTGKTMAGLIDLIARGKIARGSTVVFWHTGGIPGLFANPADFHA
ncbi:MAG: D-cysteine desulfhydrase family protein [Chloroflexi bacterium]|nr:D-cysteine desulfhydrase family protein [Chloroflexota bacterium]